MFLFKIHIVISSMINFLSQLPRHNFFVRQEMDYADVRSLYSVYTEYSLYSVCTL